MEDTLIVVIYRNGQNYLRAFLTDNILIQIFLDLFRLRQLFESKRKPVIAGYSFGLVIFADYVHAHAHTVIADIAVVIAGYQAIDQRLRLAAKGAADAPSVFILCHKNSCPCIHIHSIRSSIKYGGTATLAGQVPP